MSLATRAPLLVLACHYIGVLPLHPIFIPPILSLTINLTTQVTIPHCLSLATSVPLLVPASRSASPSGGEGAGKLTRICFAILGLLGKIYIVYINLVGQKVAGKARQLQNSSVLHVLKNVNLLMSDSSTGEKVCKPRQIFLQISFPVS